MADLSSVSVTVFFNFINTVCKNSKKNFTFCFPIQLIYFSILFYSYGRNLTDFEYTIKTFFSCWTQGLSKIQLFSQKSFFKTPHCRKAKEKRKKKLKQFFFIFYPIYKNISLNFTKHYEVRNSKNWKKSAIRNGYQFSYFAFMLLITTTSKRFQLSL